MRSFIARHISLGVVLSFQFYAQNAIALQVVSFDRDIAFGASGDWTEISVFIGYGRIGEVSSIFDSVILSTSSIGHTFSIESVLDDPDFVSFSTLFTDGVSERIMFGVQYQGGGVGTFRSESDLFSGTAPDAVGYEIERYDLILNGLTFISSGSFTDCTIDYTFQAYGSPIPEPTTSVLLTLGALPLAGRILRRRSSKREIR